MITAHGASGLSLPSPHVTTDPRITPYTSAPSSTLKIGRSEAHGRALAPLWRRGGGAVEGVPRNGWRFSLSRMRMRTTAPRKAHFLDRSLHS